MYKIIFVENLIKPYKVTKRNRGEVFTPFNLINDMLDQLPNDVWKNKDLKWFDPASGLGNFYIIIYNRLMVGLIDIIPDYNDREKHILENMIYYAEWSTLNTNIYKKLIDTDNKYNLNIYKGDTLSKDFKNHMKNVWKLKKFNIIVGNPPYNYPGKINQGQIIWDKFVLTNLNDYLIKNGYLVFVHPPLWRKPSTKKSKTYGFYNLMTKQNTMLSLYMFDSKTGKKTFNAGTKFDYYLIQKKKNNNNLKTKILTYKNIIKYIDITKFNFLPHGNIDIIMKLIDLNVNIDVMDYEKVIYNSSSYSPIKNYVSSTKTKEFKYPLIHSTNKSGIRYKYSKFNNKGIFNVKKAIFGESGINDVILDNDGLYGTTNGAFSIPYKKNEEGIKIKKILLSNYFQNNILKFLFFSNFRVDWRIFLYLKKKWWNLFDDIKEFSENN